MERTARARTSKGATPLKKRKAGTMANGAAMKKATSANGLMSQVGRTGFMEPGGLGCRQLMYDPGSFSLCDFSISSSPLRIAGLPERRIKGIDMKADWLRILLCAAALGSGLATTTSAHITGSSTVDIRLSGWGSGSDSIWVTVSASPTDYEEALHQSLRLGAPAVRQADADAYQEKLAG